MKISRIHHAAYRCKDAKETVEWYAKNLNMDFVLAIAEDLVPSTKAPDPYDCVTRVRCESLLHAKSASTY